MIAGAEALAATLDDAQAAPFASINRSKLVEMDDAVRNAVNGLIGGLGGEIVKHDHRGVVLGEVVFEREDLAAVQQIKAGLESAGITTWFDIDRLEVGDDYDRKIQRNIARCSYFIPVVSATTQRRLEGYFRREWSYAMDRVRNMADGALFILPVSIDATNAAEALVPDKFKALHFTHLPGGVVSAEFAQRLSDFMQARRQ